MATLIGIDEAGYGPVLGPLVVSSAAFEADGDVDLWESLADAVARKRRDAGERLLVADSKVVYAGAHGLANLERGVLAFLAAAGPTPMSFRELIEQLCSDAGRLCRMPWWTDTALPLAAARADIEKASKRLGTPSHRARCVGLASEVVPAGAFNELIAKYENKSVLLFQENMDLVRRAMHRYPGDLAFVLDKHGGRHYYQELLANNFFGRPVQIRRESPTYSSYEVRLDDRKLRFAFVEKADGQYLPVALASMVCKYVRELFMMCLNGYWCGRVEGLAPTSGYASDSRRFLAAIRPLFDQTDEQNFVRQR